VGGLVLAWAGLLLAGGRAGAITPEETEFFEARIRPTLVANCYKCHSVSGERIKGGLKLDTRADMLEGGDSGPAIVPGDPEASLLIKAIRYGDPDLQMPPNDRKLGPRQIEDLEQWVRMGAPDPRTGAAAAVDLQAVELENAAKHWAFQPIFPPRAIAFAKEEPWAATQLDKIALDGMRRKGLEPSPRADPATLARRAYFDLHGLPPTMEQVREFVADKSPGAFSNLVARLLASERYGERWGRHWLDVARYADTKGLAGEDREPRYIGSHNYRDWVIRSFNEDLPYDQFLTRQIAADKVEGLDKGEQAALGFLTLGSRFNNNADDIIDDRIDTVAKATLGLTVTCARCHDHKFDPIPTIDYYSWHGIFNSSREPAEAVYLDDADPARAEARRDYERQLKEKGEAIAELKVLARTQTGVTLAGRAGDYLLAAAEFAHPTNTMAKTAFANFRGLHPRWFDAWTGAVEAWRGAGRHPVFTPWLELSALTDEEFRRRAGELSAAYYKNADREAPLNPLVAQLFKVAPTTLAQVAARYGKLFSEMEQRWQAVSKPATKGGGGERPNAPKSLSDPRQEELRKLLHDPSSPVALKEETIDWAYRNDMRIRDRVRRMEEDLGELKARHPGAPSVIHVLMDKPNPGDSAVYVRGNPGNRGPVAPRRFLAALSPPERPLFRDGSGRLELAKSIASEDNPLTARVMANRIWQGHFGEPLVSTPNDFGTRCAPPEQAELLDYLAWEFMEMGWSIKRMHLLVMLSNTYQQSSEDSPKQSLIDPYNRHLWKMNRRRLDFEAMRDTILAIGGKLDLTMGGRPVPLDSAPYSKRRTVYGLVDRSKLSDMQRAFDFANPDMSTGRRDQTIVPQQALFMMNSVMVIEQAVHLVQRPEFNALSKTEDRVRLLHNLIYQRDPSEAELRMARDYIQVEPHMPRAPLPGESPWEYGLGAYDAGARRLRSYQRLPGFADGAWLGPAGARMTAAGGNAPAARGQAVIRRWVAPEDGTVGIEGSLGHTGSRPNGIVGRVLSGRGGELASWPALRGVVGTVLPPFAVVEGEPVDFLVEGGGDGVGDSFDWASVLSFTPAEPGSAAQRHEAGEQFSGKIQRRLNVWEKYAHILLQTNELTYFN